jgi:hypothetical protein
MWSWLFIAIVPDGYQSIYQFEINCTPDSQQADRHRVMAKNAKWADRHRVMAKNAKC